MHNYFIQILNYATIFDKDNLQCKFPAMVYTFNIKLDLKHKHLAQLLFVNMNMASIGLAEFDGTICNQKRNVLLWYKLREPNHCTHDI